MTKNTVSPELIRVALIGAQPVVTAGLRLLLDSSPRLEVVHECVVSPPRADKQAELPPSLQRIQADADQTDVVLVDIDAGATPLLRMLSTSVPNGTRIMIVGSTFDHGLLADAFRHGVTGAVLKQETPEVLLEAVDKVHLGQVWLDEAATAQLVIGLSGSPESKSPESKRATLLTRREREVVALVGEGLRNQEIADRLFISEVTVRNHLTSIFRKLKLSSRFELALYAFKYGLSELPTKIPTRANSGQRRRKTRKRSAS